MQIKNISVVIIAKDAAKTIEETLQSLTAFDEVVLYLNNSTDETATIAESFKNVRVIEGQFIGFGPTKNKASEYATHSWVLSLDSDEVTTPKLLQELEHINLDDPKVVYQLKRDNYLLGKKVRFSGWGKDILIRLYNKDQHGLNNNLVHEFVETHASSIIKPLKNSFKHNAVTDINQFLQKTIKYSDLGSQNKTTCCFLTVVLKAFFVFFRTYILQLGFLDGWRGFLISVANFNGKIFKYTKRYLNNQKEKKITHINFAKGFRGGERQTQILIEELSKLNYSQKLIVRKNSELTKRCQDISNLEIVEISKPYILYMHHVKNSKILHAHETKAVQFSFLTHLVTGIPYIATRRVATKIKNNIINKFMYQKAQAVAVLSNAIKNEVLKVTPKANVEIIPSAYSDINVDTEKSDQIKQRFSDKFLIGHVGALDDATKGQSFIIEAARELEKEFPDVHFLLVGAGKDAQALKKLADGLNNITFEGFVNNVNDYINCFDLFIFPSRNEGLGSVLLDVMQLNVPIIASDVGGIPDVISHNENGMLLPQLNAVELKNSIIHLYQNPTVCKSLTENAKNSIPKFSPSVMADSYKTIYTKAT